MPASSGRAVLWSLHRLVLRPHGSSTPLALASSLGLLIRLSLLPYRPQPLPKPSALSLPLLGTQLRRLCCLLVLVLLLELMLLLPPRRPAWGWGSCRLAASLAIAGGRGMFSVGDPPPNCRWLVGGAASAEGAPSAHVDDRAAGAGGLLGRGGGLRGVGLRTRRPAPPPRPIS